MFQILYNRNNYRAPWEYKRYPSGQRFKHSVTVLKFIVGLEHWKDPPRPSMILFSLRPAIPWSLSFPSGHSPPLPDAGWALPSSLKVESKFFFLWTPDLVVLGQTISPQPLDLRHNHSGVPLLPETSFSLSIFSAPLLFCLAWVFIPC